MKSKVNIILSLFLAVFALASCGGVLAPSGLALNDRTLSWNEVRNATSYRVLINQEDTLDAEENSLLLPDNYFGAMTFQVAALSGETISEYSAVLSTNVYLTLDSPINLRQEGDYVRWDEVEYSGGYIVKVGTIENVTTTTEYQVSSSTPVQVSVLASGSDDGFVLSSSYSSSIWFKVALPSPSNIAYSNGFLTWDEVSNAASYSVVIDDGSPLEAPTNQLNIGYDRVGSINFKVKALSNHEQYLDSTYGEATIQIPPLKLEAPRNLDISSGILTFDLVDHATAYGIYHEDVFIEEINNNSYAIPNSILIQSGTFLQVQARSTIHDDSDLSTKVYLGALKITTESELRAIAETGIYELNNDISLTSEWNAKEFRGVLNGKGHLISSLQISGISGENQGFFSTLNGATVSNLDLSGSITLTSTEENVAIGALAGEIIDSDISNIAVAVDLDVTSTNGIISVGGITGRLDGGQIVGATYSGDIVTESAISGGFAGRVSSPQSSLSAISESGSDGMLHATGGEQSYSGGFVGLLENNNASISESRSLMDVDGTSYVGGFVGYMAFGSIENCYSRGALDASSETFVHAGGFAGRVEGYNNSITNSIAMMTIDLTQTGNGIYIGSFAGVTPGGSYGSIYVNCYYDSTLSSFDRIGNVSLGRGDGITGLSSSGLLIIQNFNTFIWSFAGDYPRLAWEV